MHEMNWIFEQTPPPHFCLKVVCKGGEGGIFSLAYSMYNWILSASSLNPRCSQNVEFSAADIPQLDALEFHATLLINFIIRLQTKYSLWCSSGTRPSPDFPPWLWDKIWEWPGNKFSLLALGQSLVRSPKRLVQCLQPLQQLQDTAVCSSSRATLLDNSYTCRIENCIRFSFTVDQFLLFCIPCFSVLVKASLIINWFSSPSVSGTWLGA